MSKTVGIVAEYNPFHKGHKYQLDTLRAMGFEKIAIAMSGSCVQRGEIALLDKFCRAKYALDCGADLVCEIPFPYSSLSAEGFAKSGVHILKNLGVSAISFGSESADLPLLCSIAEYLLSDSYEAVLKANLEDGLSFANAREKAILAEFDLSREVIAASNDILALEYIKECRRIGWDVEFVPVKRQGAVYNDLAPKDGFASASGIRQRIADYRFEQAAEFVPEAIQQHFINRIEQGDYFAPDVAFEKTVLYSLKRLSAAEFSRIPDCNTELSHAFENAAEVSVNSEQLFENLPTKQYTKARLKRIMLFALMGIDDTFPVLPPFIRILAMNKKGEEIVKSASVTSCMPISHSYRILQDKDEYCRKVCQKESFATDMQSMFFKYPADSRRDYTTKLYKK